MTHTNVPWFVPEYDKALPYWHSKVKVELVWCGAGYRVQVVPFTKGDLDDAQLIAAAPDMFAALLALRGLVLSHIATADQLHELHQAEAAIAKAKGE